MDNELPSWYVRRPYIHFDLPLSSKDATRYVTDPANVARHPFYPLLTYEIVTPRIKKSVIDGAKQYVNNPKRRPIAYPSHKDGYIFSYYKTELEPLYEIWLKANGLDQSVTAFRSIGENNVTLAKKAFEFIRANPGCWIVATDVESFFDNIDHVVLKSIWAGFLGAGELPYDHYSVYKAITRYGVVPRHKVYNLFGIPLSPAAKSGGSPKRLCTPAQFRRKLVPRGLIEPNPGLQRGVGIPQGSSLSLLLSNIYMASLDLKINLWVESLGGKYWRYCDDILIVVPRQKRPAILRNVDRELKTLGLKRSKEKTHRLTGTKLASGEQLQYLGFIFNGTSSQSR